MKKILFAFSLAILAGCTAQTGGVEQVTTQSSMANPASVHCAQQGGRLEIRRAADGGETGFCHLPGGRVVEEWQLYREAEAAGG